MGNNSAKQGKSTAPLPPENEIKSNPQTNQYKVLVHGTIFSGRSTFINQFSFHEGEEVSQYSLSTLEVLFHHFINLIRPFEENWSVASPFLSNEETKFSLTRLFLEKYHGSTINLPFKEEEWEKIRFVFQDPQFAALSSRPCFSLSSSYHYFSQNIPQRPLITTSNYFFLHLPRIFDLIGRYLKIPVSSGKEEAELISELTREDVMNSYVSSPGILEHLVKVKPEKYTRNKEEKGKGKTKRGKKKREPREEVAEETFEEEIKLYQVGGVVRSEQKKWVHCFDDMTTVVFLLDCVTLILEMEALDESLSLCRHFCQSRIFRGVPRIIIFTKVDCLLKSAQSLGFEKLREIFNENFTHFKIEEAKSTSFAMKERTKENESSFDLILKVIRYIIKELRNEKVKQTISTIPPLLFHLANVVNSESADLLVEEVREEILKFGRIRNLEKRGLKEDEKKPFQTSWERNKKEKEKDQRGDDEEEEILSQEEIEKLRREYSLIESVVNPDLSLQYFCRRFITLHKIKV